jgi:hypothetical protein
VARIRHLISEDLLRHALPNFIGFQAVWFGALFGAAAARHWVAPVALILFLIWHFSASSRSPRADMALLAVAVAFGLVVDTLFIQIGILAFASPLPWAGVAPFWIVVLWMAFALTINVSMRWLQSRMLVAALLGLVGGPLSYWAGVRMGAAVALGDPVRVYGIIGVVWAIAAPLLIQAAVRLNRRWPEPQTGLGN